MSRALVLALVGAACGNDRAPRPEPRPELGPLDRYTEEAKQTFPTVVELYGHDQGLYRGCGPNGGVCHNGNEYPSLDSLGSVLDNIDAGCNAKREPSTFHDLCETEGDSVAIGAQPIELGWIARDATDPAGRRWKLNLRAAPAALEAYEELPVTHQGAIVWHLGYYAAIAADEGDPGGRTFILDPYPSDGDLVAQTLAAVLKDAGRPGDQLQLGDPNRNGTFGADIGGRLIKPGEPAASYLMYRLTDPLAGPLMPRANCCFWSKAAVRALWCWIDRLAVDGANALEPIDYDRCRPSPSIELLYPELGATCETSGMCPPEALVEGDGTEFASIYREIFVPRCSGAGCHDREPIGGVDLASEDSAYDTLSRKITPGDAASSVLIRRLDPVVCSGNCRTMPLGRAPLGAPDLERIRAWIDGGAAR